MNKLVSLYFVISSFIFKCLIQWFSSLCSRVFSLYCSSAFDNCHGVSILFLLLLCGSIVHIFYHVMCIFLVLYLHTSKILIMFRNNTLCTLFRISITEFVCVIATALTTLVIVLLLYGCQYDGF